MATPTPTLLSLGPNPITAGQTLTVSGVLEPQLGATAACVLTASGDFDPGLPAQSPRPVLLSLNPNPVTAGETLTVSGLSDGVLLLTGAAVCVASGSGSPINLARTVRPVLFSLTPNPLTAGQTLTVSGTTNPELLLTGTAVCVLAGSGSLEVSRPALTPPVSLDASNAESMTAAAGGAGAVVFDAAEWVEWRVDAGSGGLFELTGTITAPFWGTAELRVDNDTPRITWTYLGDFDEEETEAMPAHATSEATVSAAAGASTRIDPTPIASRYKLTIVNTHAANRLAVVTVTPAGGAAPTIDVSAAMQVEADFGERDLFLDANVAVYVRPGLTSNGQPATGPISVRVIQSATA